MPVKIIPTLRSALERLKHGGAVNGIALAHRRQLLTQLMPYEPFRVEKLVDTLHDAREHFSAGGRKVQNFWFGYDGVHVLACFRQDTLLILLHADSREADFLCKAAHTLLSDTQLLLDATLNPTGHDAQAADTQKLEAPGTVNLGRR
jgi:hypothetical protein